MHFRPVLLAVLHAVGDNMPHLQWKAGATWTLPWLGGLFLISYLGDYPDTFARVPGPTK